MTQHRSLHVFTERFPIKGRFVISRSSRTEAIVVVTSIEDGGFRGRGECVPYARYNETVESVLVQIEIARSQIERGLSRQDLQTLLPKGAARNALDCALWDLEAKRSGLSIFQTAQRDAMRPVTTAYTLSLGSPQEMARAASRAADRPLLKIKLGMPEGDPERIAAVRAAAPKATLLVDANEGWSERTLIENLNACAAEDVRLVEQPLPASEDEGLAGFDSPIPLCADESIHDRLDLPRMKGRYEAINIKLDKTGGLTEALALAEAAQHEGFSIMIGCMVATSLAMAPALLLAPWAQFVDLDGPLLLERDRPNGLVYENSLVHFPLPILWG